MNDPRTIAERCVPTHTTNSAGQPVGLGGTAFRRQVVENIERAIIAERSTMGFTWQEFDESKNSWQRDNRFKVRHGSFSMGDMRASYWSVFDGEHQVSQCDTEEAAASIAMRLNAGTLVIDRPVPPLMELPPDGGPPKLASKRQEDLWTRMFLVSSEVAQMALGNIRCGQADLFRIRDLIDEARRYVATTEKD